MKKINIFALSAVIVLCASVATQAASFSIVGGGDLTIGATGLLDIVYDPAPQGASFQNGGLGLQLTSGTPGVIEFTSAEVLNPAGRWTAVQASFGADAASPLNGFSVGSPGLPTGATSIYAQVGYKVLAAGSTLLSIGVQGEDPIFDGSQGDLSSATMLGTAEVRVAGAPIPEPATLALVGMSLIGLVVRRRNG
ncbi:PEP-CTERM sorting domain-containing protein [Bythopirellula polymerisocia]|uniref:PEP-CTERM motif protein n=1 Tax=Bythopirellula polymerisocia TaxID=2528003 RepID=A0A5C6CYZ2_9BACT|nr:PEP-CTERM sorting domain-containing protein [Bythopirellula polymerisocia]TWU28216.1 PEP-CTERM motif protein [Bythopirellula polymerisocia]